MELLGKAPAKTASGQKLGIDEIVSADKIVSQRCFRDAPPQGIRLPAPQATSGGDRFSEATDHITM
jgi:hypothetical protein